jgi:hypothetical protein
MTRIISIVGGLQPSTPTIGTATDGGTGTSANVAFTASSYIGKGTITYTATSSPGGLTGTSATSPISVTGLTTGTAYTFTVVGTTNYGVTSLTSGSSNSVTPANPDSGAMFPISSVTIGTSTVTSVIFSSIPSTYTHLQVRAYVRDATQLSWLQTSFNSDTNAANYTRHQLSGNGSSMTANFGNDYLTFLVPTTANTFGTGTIDILDYTNTNKYKTIRTIGGYDLNGSGTITMMGNSWMSNSAITSVRLDAAGDTLGQYSTFALYGIKGA